MDNKCPSHPHRLPDDCYRGFVTVAYTCCVKDKKSIVTVSDIINQIQKILFAGSIQNNCVVLAYVFMPDHCHILLQGESDNADTLKAIRIFKQKTGYLFSKNHLEIEWQRSFYDHILRSEDEIDKHIAYILDNPARKGICDDWKEYLWKGSMIYDLNEWSPL